MKIEHTSKAGEPVSTVTIDDVPAFTMGREHMMLQLFGNGTPLYGWCAWSWRLALPSWKRSSTSARGATP